MELNQLMPVYQQDGVSCYKVEGYQCLNDYYIVSEEKSRYLMNHPEVVGYEVYQSLVPATSSMLGYLKKQGKISKANILSILRGALNYPLEESCFNEGIDVQDISFMSCERVFEDHQVTGLDVKYCKLVAVDQGTLMIGDIIASGDTLVKCLQFVFDYYKERNVQIKNAIFFTIGGMRGVELLEKLTQEVRGYWPNFEGFTVVYYEGIFNCYDFGDLGVSGINRAWIDFYWKDGIITPEFRHQTLSSRDPIFEKCTIYDGGARRYEIHEHIEEVLEFWNGILQRANIIDFEALKAEKLGHALDISYEDWLKDCHYESLDATLTHQLYQQEKDFIESIKEVSLKEMANDRIREFTTALKAYMD